MIRPPYGIHQRAPGYALACTAGKAGQQQELETGEVDAFQIAGNRVTEQIDFHVAGLDCCVLFFTMPAGDRLQARDQLGE